jgi:hypothetical protein
MKARVIDQELVRDWLVFVGDFGNVNVSALLKRVEQDPEFVAAAEAVILTESRTWPQFEVFRDFCLQQLRGADGALPEPRRRMPRQRISPFSVPMELVQSMVTSRADFDVNRLRTLSVVASITNNGHFEQSYVLNVPAQEMWVVTNWWARSDGHRDFQNYRAELIEMGRSEILTKIAVKPLLEDSLPLFSPVTPNSALDVRLKTEHHNQNTFRLDITVEGWRYR